MKVEKYFLLYQIAAEQQGLFTAKQAKQAGFDERNHHYYVTRGDWEKEHRGHLSLATVSRRTIVRIHALVAVVMRQERRATRCLFARDSVVYL